ncbi:MAG: hypothetical protein JST80_03045 [Bdellovibrionales bacterium]|nr:hypothetical protein [Bdellovibrionales bacterium]
MSLELWVKNDWLKPHKTSKQEIEGLLSIVDRELKDCQIDGISSDGKFNHAYRAALTLATSLLYASGFAPSRGQSHHHRTIESIPEILGPDTKDDTAYLQNCRAKRNAAEYDSANETSESEAQELAEFAKEFDKNVRTWLKNQGY